MGGAFLSQPIKTKNTNKYQHHKIRVVTSQMQGWRKNMQDAILFHRIAKQVFVFGVFDGHGGGQVALFCAANIIKVLEANQNFKAEKYKEALIESFVMLDQMIQSEVGELQLKQISRKQGLPAFDDGKIADSVGCTANVVLMVKNTVYVANTGDSRSALSRKGQIVPLSKDHKPADQQQLKRIIGAGSVVDKGRIDGHLNLSRCLGDWHYKRNQNLKSDKQAVICHPDVVEMQLCKEDDFIIIGCDGIWERHEENGQQLIQLIRNQRCKGVAPENVLENMMDSFLGPDPKTEQLGCDNMSVILIQFNKLAF